jgi:hypothetical protein
VPTAKLRQYTEAGLLPPAHRDGDRLGYPPAEVHTSRMLASAKDLGLDPGTLTTGCADDYGFHSRMPEWCDEQ